MLKVSYSMLRRLITMNAIRMALLAALLLVGDGILQAAESFSMRAFVSAKDKWPELAKAKTVVVLNGRFAGRIGRQFRLVNFPVMITPERTTALPSDLDAGERVTITGRLSRAGSRYEFSADRIAIGATDAVKLRSQIRQLPQDDFPKAYSLAADYEKIAAFYDDELLQKQVHTLRQATFAKEREAAAGDSEKLQSLIAVAKDLRLGEELQQVLRFQSILQLSKQKGVAPQAIVTRIRKELPGWDDSGKLLSVDKQAVFLKSPVETYEGLLPEERTAYHRYLYRTVRLQDILKTVEPNGSNGNDVAAILRKELPEEVGEIKKANERYVAYRLEAVPRLSRRQLSELEELLAGLNRQGDFEKAVADWLAAQEKRLNNQQLDGLLETADQYLFAFERWKNAAYGKQGIQYLKRGWSMARKGAPEEAAKIETRLEQLGWVRLRDEWMTTAAVQALPDTDADLAMKEGRVVAGMKLAQVIAILGDPGRRIRIASKGKVQEVWVYGSGESSGITVHLTRESFDSPDSAVVTKVARARR